eukprot:907230-Rhodomonas_salina.1
MLQILFNGTREAAIWPPVLGGVSYAHVLLLLASTQAGHTCLDARAGSGARSTSTRHSLPGPASSLSLPETSQTTLHSPARAPDTTRWEAWPQTHGQSLLP